MADNSPQGGTDTIRDKDRAGVKTQIVGLDVGVGTATEALLGPANPMPVAELAAYYATVPGGQVLYSSSCGVVTAALTGTGLAALSNPAASGTALIVWKFYAAGTQAGSILRTRNATISGGVVVPNVNRGGGASAGTGVLRSGTTALTMAGGTPGKVSFIGANGADTSEERGTIVLLPGHTQAWTYTPTAGGTGTVEAVWWEVPYP